MLDLKVFFSGCSQHAFPQIDFWRTLTVQNQSLILSEIAEHLLYRIGVDLLLQNRCKSLALKRRFLEKGKLWVVSSQIVFCFLSCFFFRVVAPLHLIGLERSSSGSSFFLIQNLDWMLLIGQIWFQLDCFDFNCFRWYSEALLELRNMEHTVRR